MKRVLCTVGDVKDINTWSNIPYFFWRAGRARGFFHDGLSLDSRQLTHDRMLWNLKSLITTFEYGGYQYSERFLRKLYRQAGSGGDESEIVSHFPLLPPRQASRGPVSYYIDATLKQNFESYGIGRRVPRPLQIDATDRERENYVRADRVVCMSRWAARSVRSDYGIPADKVHVVMPGANLCEADIRDRESRAMPNSALAPLKLGFIGKDWRRKNLAFFLDVADELIRMGHPTEIVVVGPRRQDLPRHPALVPAGFIDKATNMGAFIDTVSTVHFGALFSHAEAFGISNLEFLRLGIPVLGWDVGGIADTVPDGLGHLFRDDVRADEVANVLTSYISGPERYHALRARVAARADEFTWDRTVGRFMTLWDETYETASPDGEQISSTKHRR